MKDVRPRFTDEEHTKLKAEADRLGISLKQLVRNRALGNNSENAPLNIAKVLSKEMADIRETMNHIIRRETTVEERLYEDDVIRLEMCMTKLEEIVTTFVGTVLRRMKSNGNVDI